jgi:hypothetical protein
VVRDEGAWVEGMVLSGVTIAERDHLVRYEGENYVRGRALAEFPERPPNRCFSSNQDPAPSRPQVSLGRLPGGASATAGPR